MKVGDARLHWSPLWRGECGTFQGNKEDYFPTLNSLLPIWTYVANIFILARYMRRVTQSWLLQYRGQILSATPVPKLAISCCSIPSSVRTTNTLLLLYQIYQYEKLAFAKRRHLKGLESDSKMATMYCKPSHHWQQITWRKESYDAVWQHKRLYQWLRKLEKSAGLWSLLSQGTAENSASNIKVSHIFCLPRSFRTDWKNHR